MGRYLVFAAVCVLAFFAWKNFRWFILPQRYQLPESVIWGEVTEISRGGKQQSQIQLAAMSGNRWRSEIYKNSQYHIAVFDGVRLATSPKVNVTPQELHPANPLRLLFAGVNEHWPTAQKVENGVELVRYHEDLLGKDVTLWMQPAHRFPSTMQFSTGNEATFVRYTLLETDFENPRLFHLTELTPVLFQRYRSRLPRTR